MFGFGKKVEIKKKDINEVYNIFEKIYSLIMSFYVQMNKKSLMLYVLQAQSVYR